MKLQTQGLNPSRRAERIRTGVLLLAAVLVFCLARGAVAGEKTSATDASEYAEYETATITEILSDSTEADEASDGGYRGEQLMLAEVSSGQYKGESLLVYNFVGPLYGVPLKVGDSAVLIISTFADGSHKATVHEYNRLGPILIVLGIFVLVTVLVGGKTGAKALLGLLFTVLVLFYVLIPALLKGAPTILTTVLCAAYVTVVSLAVIAGTGKKSLCAMLGTIAGMVFAGLFALFAQKLMKIDGLRITDVEPLLQLRQTGTPVGLRGLLAGGVIISALGAVMDVAVSMASALSEVHSANEAYGRGELFRSGMNIGRDMVGTMTNTLILAFLGSSFTLMIYLYSMGLSFHQLVSSAYVALEVISGIAGSIGVILTIPLTALVCAVLYAKREKGGTGHDR